MPKQELTDRQMLADWMFNGCKYFARSCVYSRHGDILEEHFYCHNENVHITPEYRYCCAECPYRKKEHNYVF